MLDGAPLAQDAPEHVTSVDLSSKNFQCLNGYSVLMDCTKMDCTKQDS
uniref:Uncharacterized protein n=1 Tax=Arundo donax TaxID=35708 RepID=A0A0A8ZSA9_ARUDO